MSTADYEQRLANTGRNDACPCGSGKKYKKCHLPEDERERSLALAALKKAAEVEAAAKKEDDQDAQGGKAAAVKGSAAGKRKAPSAPGQPPPKGQARDGKPKNIPRRGAV